MVEIKWEEPPRRGIGPGARGIYHDIIDQLKENPGRWAKVIADWPSNKPPNVFRQNKCEIVVRRNEDKTTWSIYSRYDDPAAAAAEAAKEAAKQKVTAAVSTGTALKPPPPPLPRKGAPAPANDMGMSKFLAERRARGAVDRPE
ncbi:hypothetical protein [Pseudarthrobacter sp. CCNWLW207]|uniref:hypothetical protein n=1 Tax=Pseudarthrobacter sp. CCNWLW207 TaxID=3127468 RepID=UPI003076EE56